MLLNSLTFLVFLAAVVAMHHGPFSWDTKKRNLTVASYAFYAAWNPPFVVLIWISTLIDWYAARKIHESESMARRRAFLALTLLTNLGLLGYFKYGAFLLDNFVSMLASAGIAYHPPELDIVLPVGISFFTFQTLSYSIDVYRGNLRPWPNLRDFALFVTFFPQLVAGPIVRAREFLPQCQVERRVRPQQRYWGLALLLLGVFEKDVIADGLLAPVVEEIYDSRGEVGALAAWTGTLAFSGQIFCDFAGYSTCAIGVALILGFSLPDNFRFPYAAVGFSDFWRRWHISLSSWLRDYLYIPMGGSRHGSLRTVLHLGLTMLVGGLWHGASWTFVLWGALHGTYLVVERALVRVFGGWGAWRHPVGQSVLAAATFAAVTFTWVFFRAGDFDRAFEIAAAMLGLGSGVESELTTRQLMLTYPCVASICGVHWLLRGTSLEDVAGRVPGWVVALVTSGMAFSVVTMSGDNRAFIYFQF